MAKLKIRIDNDNDKLVLGGLCITVDENGVPSGFHKILGIYKDGVEVFSLINKDIDIIEQSRCIPAKLTIDGINVAKESYKVFIADLDADYKYIVKSYLVKPKKGEVVDIVDLSLLNSDIFNKLSDKSVTIDSYNKLHHNYIASTDTGFEIFLRRAQFVLEKDNKIEIATLERTISK